MIARISARFSSMIMKTKRCLFHCSFALLLKQNFPVKLFAVFFIFISTFVIWSQYPGGQFTDFTLNVVAEEAIRNVELNPKYAEIYRRKSHLPKDIKYILLWTPEDYAPFYFLGKGQREFIKNNCSMINCYVTTDRKFFGEDLTKFHAVAFNGRNIQFYTKNDLPRIRSPHQKYIYFNMESADNIPVCKDTFDNFFNWTATYKLNSDILYTYLLIKDKEENFVGPRENMSWVENMEVVDDNFAERLHNKSIAAAWFVSNCRSRSKREKYVHDLERYLKAYDLNLDIYGSCGPFKCPRYRQSHCEALLERNYYFYMSLENSFAEDYVTEMLLSALQHDIVPVVFGGANYSRFLPPGSYLDGRQLSITELADAMHRLIQSPRLYQQFFRWKNHYTYLDASQQNVCNVCAALNDRTKFESASVYYDFRAWWNVRNPPDLCAK